MTTSTPGGDVELRRGREAPQWTDVHDWVSLSGVSPHALALYVLLRMHVNRGRGDDMVKTGTLTLAVLMGLSRGDKITPYLDELEKLGAIDVERGGLHRKNKYVVHQLPPAGYTGATTIKTWYERHRALIALKKAAEKVTRDARRERKKAGTKTAVTPETGEQPVTPKSGEPVTPETGQAVTPETGREPKEVEPDEVEPPTPPGGSSSATPQTASDQQEKEEETPSADQQQVPAYDEALAAEAIAARPDWSPTTTREVLADPLIRERNPDLVRAAVRDAIATPKTTTLRRLLHDACPHWARAAHVLGLLAAKPAATPTGTPHKAGRPVDDGRAEQLLAGADDPQTELTRARARIAATQARNRSTAHAPRDAFAQLVAATTDAPAAGA